MVFDNDLARVARGRRGDRGAARMVDPIVS
jgi:hypothetical protein